MDDLNRMDSDLNHKYALFKNDLKVNRKTKRLVRSDLEQQTKEKLVDRLLQLEAHNLQLRNILQKEVHGCTSKKKKKTSSSIKAFDFSTSNKRHIFIKIYYLGWDYQGFTIQEHTTATIEYHVFNALVKTCLIEDRTTSNYHRCGRTDKGVSAFCQVISIDVRSKFPPEQQLTQDALENEINYCEMLNRILPRDIRALAWMPLESPDTSARFDCYLRTYRFYFPRGDFNIDKMRTAAHSLIGSHDFRNLCKMDVANGVMTFVREVTHVVIEKLAADLEGGSDERDQGYDMYYFELTGSAFLWHQIRCIMAILFLVGEEREDASVISELLNVEKNPCKPQYSLACDLPLNLYRTEYHESLKHDWIHDQKNLDLTVKILQRQWTQSSIKTSMMRDMLRDLTKLTGNRRYQSSSLTQGVHAKEYQTILTRKTCKSLENRIEHYVKKRRLDVAKDEENDPEV